MYELRFMLSYDSVNAVNSDPLLISPTDSFSILSAAEAWCTITR